MAIRPIDPQVPQPPSPRPRPAGDGAPFADVLARALATTGPDPRTLRAAAELLRLEAVRAAGSLAPGLAGGSAALLGALSGARAPSPPAAPAPAPQEYLRALATRAAERHGLAPALVLSVIEAESGFDPRAVSRAGAQGLMQLMPATAADLGVTDPFDPAQNIEGGTRYLRWLLDRYDGDLDRTLAAYNWGLGNLERSPRALPAETRQYVARVKGAVAKAG